MKKILVPTDFSQTSLNALKYAAGLAKKNNSKLHLLNISFLPTFYADGLNNYSFYRNDLENAVKRIKSISKSEIDVLLKLPFLEKIEIESEVLVGYSIYYEIINYAKKIKPDIIIMGSHSGKKGSLFKIGSNTERVIRTTEIPVIVVKKQSSPSKIKKIVFASDFEKDARKVYPFLHSLVREYNPEIHLLYINTKTNFREYEDIKLQIIRFKKLFPGNFKMLVRAAKHIDEGIVKYSNSINADLIALGVKRRKGLSLYLTDRITEGVIDKSKIPVLAIDNPK
jgi:nucleotide-binding universal stress UspA family protein